MNKSGIYKITNNKNDKVYIGSSANLKSRKYQHFKMLEKDIHVNRHLQNAYNEDGKDNFKWEVLENIEFNEDKTILRTSLLTREQYWIDIYFGEHCYNFNPIAGSSLGIKLSEETKIKIGRSNSISLKGRRLPQEVIEKIRQANLGKKMSPESIEKCRQAKLGYKVSEETKEKLRQINRGRQHSSETKKKMSDKLRGNTHTLGKKLSEEHKRKIGEKSKGNRHALGNKMSEENKEKLRERMAGNTNNRGKKLSEEAKIKIGQANLGREVSPETREKIRQANIGKKLSDEHKRKIGEKSKGRTSKKVINLDTELIFNNITEASSFYNLDTASISKVCKGKRKICGGYRWSYYSI